MAQVDEEDLLRSVAIQNARSILLARQRAEQELIEAKEALELKTQALAHSLALVRATLECATDGIVMLDEGGKVTGFNENFLKTASSCSGGCGRSGRRGVENSLRSH